MADQHCVAQIVVLEDIDDVHDVRVEIDCRIGEVRPLAESRIARCHEAVRVCSEQRVHFLPGPARRPSAVRDDESRAGRRGGDCADAARREHARNRSTAVH